MALVRVQFRARIERSKHVNIAHQQHEKSFTPSSFFLSLNLSPKKKCRTMLTLTHSLFFLWKLLWANSWAISCTSTKACLVHCDNLVARALYHVITNPGPCTFKSSSSRPIPWNPSTSPSCSTLGLKSIQFWQARKVDSRDPRFASWWWNVTIALFYTEIPCLSISNVWTCRTYTTILITGFNLLITCFRIKCARMKYRCYLEILD